MADDVAFRSTLIMAYSRTYHNRKRCDFPAKKTLSMTGSPVPPVCINQEKDAEMGDDMDDSNESFRDSNTIEMLERWGR